MLLFVHKVHNRSNYDPFKDNLWTMPNRYDYRKSRSKLWTIMVNYGQYGRVIIFLSVNYVFF